MTTRKITTFLMCPATNGDALGGTPAASAASGGHIKKSAWICVHDAALLVLSPLIEQGIERTAPDKEQADQDQPDDEERGEDGGGHDGLPLLVRERQNDFADDPRNNNGECEDHKERSKSGHVSALYLGFGLGAALGGTENGPVHIWTKHFAANQASRGLLDSWAALGRNAADATRPLPNELRLTADGNGDGGLPPWRLVNVFSEVHDALILSAPLLACQAARLLRVSCTPNGIGR